MSDIISNLKQRYKTGNVMVKLIFINLAVFVFIKIVNVVFTLFNLSYVDMAEFVAISSNMKVLIKELWTPFTYMFVHEDLWHILFNMLWLYWFGSIFLQFFSGRTMGSLYVLGGLAGAALYLISFNTIPYYIGIGSGNMIGASAAVMAIVMGCAFYRPDIQLNLLFIGSVKIIYIAIVVFVLDFISLGDTANPGGHIAHIGGALVGYLFAMQYKRGRDITEWISRLIDAVVNMFKPRKRKAKMKVTSARYTESDRDYNYRKHNEQAEIDAILDKLKKSGYSSLTEKEKKRLFDASKN